VLYIEAGEGCPDEFINPDFLGDIKVTGVEYNVGDKQKNNVEKTFTFEEKEIVNDIVRLRYSLILSYKTAEYFISTPLPEGYIWNKASTYEFYYYYDNLVRDNPDKKYSPLDELSFNTSLSTDEMSTETICVFKIPE
jgi:hypothetical protein